MQKALKLSESGIKAAEKSYRAWQAEQLMAFDDQSTASADAVDRLLTSVIGAYIEASVCEKLRDAENSG